MTVSATPATVSVTGGTVALLPTSNSMSVISDVAKPGQLDADRVPARRQVLEPVASVHLVTATDWRPVVVSVAVTMTPGITPLDSSTTVPCIVAFCCATETRRQQKSADAHPANRTTQPCDVLRR